MTKKPKFDILKTTNKGQITLTSAWLKKNLNLDEGEMVAQINISPTLVLLTKFDIFQNIDEQTGSILNQFSRTGVNLNEQQKD